MNKIIEQAAIEWLRAKITMFIDQYDPNEPKDEFWMNNYENIKYVLDGFYEFIDQDNIEKEKRRKLYEELKAEFEK